MVLGDSCERVVCPNGVLTHRLRIAGLKARVHLPVQCPLPELTEGRNKWETSWECRVRISECR